MFNILQVSKIKQMMLSDARDGPVRPVIRTFYDHLQVTDWKVLLFLE